MAFFSWRNWIDADQALLTADAEAGDFSVANLRERQGYKVWRTDGLSPGVTDAGFDVDFGTARSVQCLALMFPRTNDPTAYDEPEEFAATDTVRHRLSNVSAGAGEAYDSGVVQSGVLAGYGYHLIKLNAPVTARYWRCDLDAISRGDLGWVDVARAWAGPVFEPVVGFSFGDTYGWSSEASTARASRGISEFADNVEPVRSWTLNFDGLSDSDREQLIEFERLVVASAQFLVWRGDVAAGKGTMFARQQQSLGVTSLAHLRNSKAFRLAESL